MRGAARSSEIDSMECFVYILGSSGKDGYRTYVGWTTDLDRRLAQHNAGTGARSTRGRVWVVLYAEQHATRREAMSREWHLKRDRRLRKQLARSGRGHAVLSCPSKEQTETAHMAEAWERVASLVRGDLNPENEGLDSPPSRTTSAGYFRGGQPLERSTQESALTPRESSATRTQRSSRGSIGFRRASS